MHKIPLVMARGYQFSDKVHLKPGDTLGELHVPETVQPVFVANGIVNGMIKAVIETPAPKDEPAAAPAAPRADESFDAAGE